MKLAIHLVTWNGAGYIPELFRSLQNQSFTDWELFVLDNGSQDETVINVKKEFSIITHPHHVVEEKINLGFAGGHNRLFALDKNNTNYILIVNQDIILEPDCLQKLVDFLDTHQEAAAVAPRLMRLNEKDKIDSLGLRIFHSRRLVDIDAGKTWQTTNEKHMEVFGVTGALALFRRSALDTVSFAPDEIFDSLYTNYKEDVDLAFRLQSAGYNAYMILDAVAYHARGAGDRVDLSDWAASKNKKRQAVYVRYQSYKNHLMTVYKNEYWQNIVFDFPWILWYELKKFGWLLLSDWSTLRGLREIWKHRELLRKHRTFIKNKRKKSWREIRRWWK